MNSLKTFMLVLVAYCLCPGCHSVGIGLGKKFVRNPLVGFVDDPKPSARLDSGAQSRLVSHIRYINGQRDESEASSPSSEEGGDGGKHRPLEDVESHLRYANTQRFYRDPVDSAEDRVLGGPRTLPSTSNSRIRFLSQLLNFQLRPRVEEIIQNTRDSEADVEGNQGKDAPEFMDKYLANSGYRTPSRGGYGNRLVQSIPPMLTRYYG